MVSNFKQALDFRRGGGGEGVNAERDSSPVSAFVSSLFMVRLIRPATNPYVPGPLNLLFGLDRMQNMSVPGQHQFICTWVQILVTELGDETFIIAAIMAMRHGKAIVYAGAMSALGFMTVPLPLHAPSCTA